PRSTQHRHRRSSTEITGFCKQLCYPKITNMRRTRRLILLLIIVIVAVVGFIYNKEKIIRAKEAPAIPASLPNGTSAKLNGWSWTKDDGSRTVVRVFAKDMREI